VQYPAKVIWREGEEISVTSSDELAAVLDRFERDSISNRWPLLAQVTDREGHAIIIGVAVEGACFEFTSKEIKESMYYRDFVSTGDDNATGVVSFWLLDHHSDLSRSCLISVQSMKDAVRHYLETGQLSEQVRWLDCSSCRPDSM